MNKTNPRPIKLNVLRLNDAQIAIVIEALIDRQLKAWKPTDYRKLEILIHKILSQASKGR